MVATLNIQYLVQRQHVHVLAVKSASKFTLWAMQHFIFCRNTRMPVPLSTAAHETSQAEGQSAQNNVLQVWFGFKESGPM